MLVSLTSVELLERCSCSSRLVSRRLSISLPLWMAIAACSPSAVTTSISAGVKWRSALELHELHDPDGPAGEVQRNVERGLLAPALHRGAAAGVDGRIREGLLDDLTPGQQSDVVGPLVRAGSALPRFSYSSPRAEKNALALSSCRCSSTSKMTHSSQSSRRPPPAPRWRATRRARGRGDRPAGIEQRSQLQGLPIPGAGRAGRCGWPPQPAPRRRAPCRAPRGRSDAPAPCSAISMRPTSSSPKRSGTLTRVVSCHSSISVRMSSSRCSSER